MKSIVAATLLALSLVSAAASADDTKSDAASGATIVIYATSMEDAQKQVQSLDVDPADVIVVMKNADGTVTELRGVNFVMSA